MSLTIDRSAERKPERELCRLAVLAGIGSACELVVALLLLGGTGLEVLDVLLAGRADAGASCDGRESDYISR